LGLTIVAKSSAAIYYASKCGVKSDGTDQHTAVQAILNLGQNSLVTFIVDIPFTVKGCRVYSGTTIDGMGYGATITQATCTSLADCFTFSNANWNSSYNATPGASTNDHDITVRNLRLDGNYRNGSSGSGVNAPGSRTAKGGGAPGLLYFLGVNNLKIENIDEYDAISFGLWLANVFDLTVHNINGVIPNSLAGFNGSVDSGTDIVHVNGPAARGSIRDIRGANSDDFVALNAIDGNMLGTWSPPNFGMLYYGDITDFVVSGLFPKTCMNCIRFLSGLPNMSGQPALTPCKIDNVVVENVNGYSYQNAFTANAFDVLGSPVLGHVILRNFNVRWLTMSGTSGQENRIGGTVSSFQISGFQIGDRTAHQWPIVAIDTGSNTTAPNAPTVVDRLSISDVVVRESSTDTTINMPLVSVPTGTVNELVLSKVSYSRGAATTTALVEASGGTIGRLNMGQVSGNNIANIVKMDGGTVNLINSTGLSHQGAGGNASINVASGSLPILNAVASDTQLLSSGTISRKTTDHSEIA
jgi:hypothetical protein